MGRPMWLRKSRAIAVLLFFVSLASPASVSAFSLGQPENYPVSSEVSGGAVGDVTGDGRDDAIVVTTKDYFDSDPADYMVLLYAQEPDGSLASPTQIPYGPSKYGPDVAIGDLNGDSLNDVALTITIGSIPGTGGLDILYQQGGTLLPPVRLSRPQHVYLNAIADMEGDGDNDIVAIEYGLTTLFTNDGAGVFTPSTIANDWVSPLAIGDYDDDGNLDVGGLNGHFHTYLQRTGGWMPDVHTVPDASSLSTAATGDMSGDGRDDLVVAFDGSNASGIAVLEQQPDGEFAVTAREPGVSEAWPLRLADMDGDGRLDAVVGHEYGFGGVGVFRALPGGDFLFEHVFSVLDVGLLAGMGIGDLDGDGRKDIALADIYGDFTLVPGQPDPGDPVTTKASINKVQGRRGKYVLVPYGSLVLSGSTIPKLPWGGLAIEWQRSTASGWVDRASETVLVGGAGVAKYPLWNTDLKPRTSYRVRWTFLGDATRGADVSRWLFFRTQS